MLPTDRPYFRYTTRELWSVAIGNYNDRDELALVLAELQHRTILPAKIMRSFVFLRFAELGNLPSATTSVDEEPDELPSHGPRVVTPIRAEEEIDEATRDNVQSTVVELWGLDGGGSYERRRRGFLLDASLLVTGSFIDDATIAEIKILHRGDELAIDPLPLDVHQAVDLKLYAAVDRPEASSDWEMVMAEITPPNVGDILAAATENDWVEFEFNTMREIPGWGTVLALPTLSLEMDGAPIVNEFGRLVGITRVRWVEDELVSFGLPVRWLFDLLRGTLASKLAYLRQWETWRSENWDSLNRMPKAEFASKLAIEELEAELVTERERIEELEAELVIGRELKESNCSEENAPPTASQKAWPWLKRLMGGIRR